MMETASYPHSHRPYGECYTHALFTGGGNDGQGAAWAQGDAISPNLPTGLG